MWLAPQPQFVLPAAAAAACLPACLATYQDVDSVEDMSLGQFMIRLHEETPDDAIDAIVEALEAAIAEDREWEVEQLREDLEALDITQIVLNFFFTTLSIVVPQHNTTSCGQRGHLSASAYQRGALLYCVCASRPCFCASFRCWPPW